MEDLMPELEMKNEAEAEVEEFSDELSDEALDRQQGGGKFTFCDQHCICRDGN
jgi:hypothetical protein